MGRGRQIKNNLISSLHNDTDNDTDLGIPKNFQQMHVFYSNFLINVFNSVENYRNKGQDFSWNKIFSKFQGRGGRGNFMS